MSYDASLYAQLHRGTPGDVGFYLDAVRTARHVLELGCGYGRILTALVKAGHRATGLDIDPDMLELAKSARAALTPAQASLLSICQGDMRDFRLEQRFDRVLIPFNGLYCMLSESAVIDCLRCAGEHLNENGKLVFDAYAIDDFHRYADPQDINSSDDEDDKPIESLRWNHTNYDVYESCVWDKASQRLEVSYRHVPDDGGEVKIATLTHRYLLSTQVRRICKQAGLKLVHHYQDFAGTPLGPHAGHMACIAQKRP